MKSYVVYQFNWPGCNDSYIGKANLNLCIRVEEHACSDKESAICNHINNWSYYGYIQNKICFNNDSFDHYFVSIQSKVMLKNLLVIGIFY